MLKTLLERLGLGAFAATVLQFFAPFGSAIAAATSDEFKPVLVKTGLAALLWWLSAKDINWWVSFFSLVYILLNIGLVIPRYWYRIKRWLMCRYGNGNGNRP